MFSGKWICIFDFCFFCLFYSVSSDAALLYIIVDDKKFPSVQLSTQQADGRYKNGRESSTCEMLLSNFQYYKGQQMKLVMDGSKF